MGRRTGQRSLKEVRLSEDQRGFGEVGAVYERYCIDREDAFFTTASLF